MPILKTRHQYKKIWRPSGTKYAHGITQMNINAACNSALLKFYEEFGYTPETDDTIYEVIGVTAGFAVTILEIKEDWK